MSVDWPVVTLKEAGISLIDCDHKTPKAQEEGLPYVGIPQLKNGRIVLDGARLISEEDFVHWRRKAKPIPDDVVLSRRCNPGEIAYVPQGLEIALGQNLVLLRSDGKKVFPPFLRWVAQGRNWWYQVNKYINVGAVFDSLKCADIPKFEFKLPPMEEQKLIANVLGDLDKKIELNQQTNQTLEHIAQALFKSWFVDFEPTRAKITAKQAGQDPERAAMAAISGKTLNELDQLSSEQLTQLEATAALFPDELVDSELGEVPEGWEVRSIRDLGKVITGKTPAKKVDDAYSDIGMPFVTPTDIDDSMFVVSTNRHLTVHGQLAVKKSKIEAGSICVTCIGSQMGKATISPKGAFTNQQINSIIVDEPYYRNYLLLNLRNRREEIYHIGSSGSTMPIINKTTFEQLDVIAPDIGILKAFDAISAPLIDKILADALENIELSRVRDTLLPKLLSGELPNTNTKTPAPQGLNP